MSLHRLARIAVTARLSMGREPTQMIESVEHYLGALACEDSDAVQEASAARLADLAYMAARGFCPLSRSAPNAVAWARVFVADGGRVSL